MAKILITKRNVPSDKLGLVLSFNNATDKFSYCRFVRFIFLFLGFFKITAIEDLVIVCFDFYTVRIR